MGKFQGTNCFMDLEIYHLYTDYNRLDVRSGSSMQMNGELKWGEGQNVVFSWYDTCTGPIVFGVLY